MWQDNTFCRLDSVCSQRGKLATCSEGMGFHSGAQRRTRVAEVLKILLAKTIEGES